MEMKRWNRGMLALVALLLILAIIATINIIIKQYSTEKMQFGSWSDWFNTAGTLGTFAIAAMAYRKAPDWIKQRKHEDAFSIAKELIFDTLPAIYAKIDSAGMETYYIMETAEVTSEDIRKFVTLDLCDKNLEIWYKNTNSPLNTTRSISKLSRLGWHTKPNTSKALDELKKSYRDVHMTHVKTWVQIKMTLNNNISESRLEELQKSIPILIQRLAAADNAFKIRYSEFHSLYVNIDDYFNIR